MSRISGSSAKLVGENNSKKLWPDEKLWIEERRGKSSCAIFKMTHYRNLCRNLPERSDTPRPEIGFISLLQPSLLTGGNGRLPESAGMNGVMGALEFIGGE